MAPAPTLPAEATYVNTAIYYFSGTGNSLHVARELQKRIPESNLVPVVRLLDQDTIQTSADTVGCVFPNFCMTVPIPIHDLMEKVDVTSARYVFALCTRGGTSSEEAFGYINAMLNRQNKELNAQLSISMPWNHPLGKENLPGTATRERIQHLESEMQNQLDVFSKCVMAHEAYSEADTGAIYEIPRWMKRVISLIPKSFNYELHRYMYQDLVRFYSDSKCNGCSVCEKVCPSNKIEIADQKPVWKKAVKCHGCFACINFCPQQAIQIESRLPLFRSYTEVNARYHHPAVTYKDIAEQR